MYSVSYLSCTRLTLAIPESDAPTWNCSFFRVVCAAQTPGSKAITTTSSARNRMRTRASLDDETSRYTLYVCLTRLLSRHATPAAQLSRSHVPQFLRHAPSALLLLPKSRTLKSSVDE